MMIEYNFDEFTKPSKQDWLNKLNQDLGADLAGRALNWSCEENLELSAYYNKEDLAEKTPILTRSTGEWKYLQKLNESNSNNEVHEALMNGADGLLLDGSLVDTIDKSLNKVSPEYCTISVVTNENEVYAKFVDWWVKSHTTSKKGEVLIFDSIDKIEHYKPSQDIAFLDEAFGTSEKHGHKLLSLNGALIQRAGGSVIVELAYILSQAVFKINHLLDQGKSWQSINKSLFINTAVGSSYFLELSKVRAARLLLTQLLSQYQKEDYQVPIYATTSSLTKSNLDSNSNFLRCTSEAMSAILGGVDYLSIEPNHSIKSANRIARNISNLLREESSFGKVNDPSGGSYYIEHLTAQLAKEAWDMFQEIESKGGFQWAVENDFFTNHIQNEFAYKKQKLNSGKRKMVGVNDYGNSDEKLASTDLPSNFVSLSSKYEELRRSVEVCVEAGNHRPVIYLMPVGSNAKMINARFTFVTNFFNWAGFEVLKTNNQVSSKGIAVCCGADEDYTEDLISATLSNYGDFVMVLAAGKKLEESSSQISGWVNMKSDRLATIENILNEMGILTNSKLS